MASSIKNPQSCTDAESAIGGKALRREDAKLVTGQGQFTGDVSLEDALWVTFARSTVAKGKISSISVEDAKEVPGIEAVFTGDDVAALGHLFVAPVLEQHANPPFPVLAASNVEAVGQPIAGIVSTSRAAGLDAAELIDIEIEEEEAVLFDGAASSDEAFGQTWRKGDVESAFAGAAHIAEVSIHHPRLAPSSLEPRSIAVKYDAASEQLTVWLSTQTPHRARTELAKITGIAPDAIHVIAPDVGGAFGLKASLYPEEVFTVWAAHRLKRSLRWTASRSEELLSATHGRGARTTAKLALDASGRFIGLKAEVKFPLGHWLSTSAGI
ncbi:MAG: xanthine dehydrogenase family protein molybdopterin-binding subunit, partial [Hyphomicrobiales bacterium]